MEATGLAPVADSRHPAAGSARRESEGNLMHRVLVEIPGLGTRLSSFSVFFLLACVSALTITAWRARREKLNPDDVYGLAIWLMGGGYLGARGLFLAIHPETIHHFTDIFKVWEGGIVFYGCIVGGLLGSVIYWSRNRFPFLPMADAVAPALVLGAGIGRVGCFYNGCCYGAVSHQAWAVSFPAGSLPWARHVMAGWISASSPFSLPVQPTQLFSALDGLLLFGLLMVYFPRRRRDGEVMALLMVTYPVTRFLIEALRQDEGAAFAGMTVSQLVSVGILLCGLALWTYLRRLPEGRFADRQRRGALAADAFRPTRTIRESRDVPMVTSESRGR
jgi:phosphatidylglycerol:prolipoprotein diacylglycerol transferase